MPRIAVHDFAGHPFQVHLSRELARRGHDVVHLHCPSYATGRGAIARRAGDPETFLAEPVSLKKTFDRYSPWRRLVQEHEYGRRVLERVRRFEPDLVLSSNTPLLAQRRFLRGCRRVGIPFVFWQQDLHSLAIKRHAEEKIPLVGRRVGQGFVALERSLLQHSDAVVSISPDFLPILGSWGIPREGVHVISNWAPLEELPMLPGENAWAREHDLVGKKVVLYAGSLGLKHDPALLLRLATQLRAESDARVVVVSEGPGADWLRDQVDRLDVGNLLLLGFQPYERLPELHATADLLLALLDSEARVFSVPSKVLTYLCAGRALLAAIPAENLAARVLLENDCGVVVPPGDPESFVATAQALLADAELRDRLGRNARAYAEATFDIAKIGDRFEAVFAQALWSAKGRDLRRPVEREPSPP
jgi:glycosyltransferase involved in cell wall biosynthesis